MNLFSFTVIKEVCGSQYAINNTCRYLCFIFTPLIIITRICFSLNSILLVTYFFWFSLAVISVDSCFHQSYFPSFDQGLFLALYKEHNYVLTKQQLGKPYVISHLGTMLNAYIVIFSRLSDNRFSL